MVRLKVLTREGYIAIEVKFQFHNGSIKSSECGQRFNDKDSFNSTMVRLKD